MSRPRTALLSHPIAGVGFCVFALFAFSIQDALVKLLCQDYPVLEVLTLRSVFVLTLLIAAGIIRHGTSVFVCPTIWPLLLRGTLAFAAFSTYYLALTVVPLADAAAVYLTGPLFVTILSVVFLRERVGWHRWFAVLFGFSAVLVMLNPGGDVFKPAAALPLFSALCYAVIPILTRRFGLDSDALTMSIFAIISYLSLCIFAGLLVHLIPQEPVTTGLWASLRRHWTPMDLAHMGLTLVASGFFSVGLLAITQAYRVTAVSVVAPFEYSYLLWASLLGFIVFGDIPSVRTALGGLTIVACGCYVIYREHQSKMVASSA